MSELSIRVEGLGKRYRLGVKTQPYYSIRESVAKIFTAPFRRRKETEEADDILWALKEVSFDIKRGEVIGLIGRNGAGKSTLLKVLSRITEPTAGSIELYGRVGSLLEVGTGFHPELTGRENIYLNGSILGMRKFEIERKFDEIVAFAEVERFLDTPVKRYSSGMYVRLAFAVAAHLEPEILLVDEVLAVGDVAFQKKCLGKMNEVAQEGRTVIFVSHNMSMITTLTSRCLLLESGRVVAQGNTSDVVLNYYSSGNNSPSHFDTPEGERAPGDQYVRLLSVSVTNQLGERVSEIDISEPVIIKTHFRVLQKHTARFLPNFNFYTSDGTYAFCAYIASLYEKDPSLDISQPGEYIVECTVPRYFLNTDTYFVSIAVVSFEKGGGTAHVNEKSIVSFNVREELEQRQELSGHIKGVIRPLLKWQTQRLT